MKRITLYISQISINFFCFLIGNPLKHTLRTTRKLQVSYLYLNIQTECCKPKLNEGIKKHEMVMKAHTPLLKKKEVVHKAAPVEFTNNDTYYYVVINYTVKL